MQAMLCKAFLYIGCTQSKALVTEREREREREIGRERQTERECVCYSNSASASRALLIDTTWESPLLALTCASPPSQSGIQNPPFNI